MSFKVAARMILELGAELISSDAVALYELVKNSIDAGSQSVAVRIQVVLTRSHFLEASEAIADNASPGAVRKRLLNNLSPDAPQEAVRAFGDAIIGAGNNARRLSDALAGAYGEHNWIRVEDSGHGMTADELQSVFLTIGTRSRRREKVDASGNFVKPTRGFLGDKGVGRLSAMRLGEHMTVTTSCAGERYENILEIDWSRSFPRIDGHDRRCHYQSDPRARQVASQRFRHYYHCQSSGAAIGIEVSSAG